MTAPLRLAPGELTVEELMERLRAGTRIVMEREMGGSTHEITLRYDGDVYYCDTPTTLHRHQSPDEMRTCLRKEGYGRE